MKLPPVRRITDATRCACPCVRDRFQRRRGTAPPKPKPADKACAMCGGTGKTRVGVARRFTEAMNADSLEA